MTKRFAFTLAEVLIALAIIGVVAAMTIPTFMANTAGAQFRTGFKKGITVLTQAASANYATEGYDFGSTNVAYGSRSEAEATHSTVAALSADTARIGFNTQSYANDTAAGDNIDMVSDVQSLFHLFQGNLNMKNSNEIANYDVGMPDVALHCDGAAFNITVPGTSVSNTAVTFKTLDDMDERPGAVAAPGEDEDDNRTLAQKTQTKGGIANLCGGRTVANGGFNQGRMFALEDGMVFTYDPGQQSCTEGNPCYGYLDVNGAQGPNKLISCSTGQNSYIPSYGRNADGNLLMASCTVNAKDITDIYPVLFYGSTVKPASLAAKAVLYSQKSNQN